MSERLVVPGSLSDEERYDVALRPRSLDGYVGQTRIVDNLRVFITAARQRDEPLDHVLLFGPPGLGKTTLANIIAHEMQVDLRSTSGPVIEKVGDLAAILTNLEDDALLFIDEIHRLSAVIEEILYPAMEDYQIDIVIGEGPSARSVKLPLPRFTLVGSTTRAALLTSPLRGRFGIVFRLDYYSQEELAQIVANSAELLGVDLGPGGGLEIARRSRGTPRVANRLLRRVRDYAQVQGDDRIDQDVARSALQVVRYGPVKFVPELVANQLCQHWCDAAELRVAEGIRCPCIGEETTVRVASAFGDHDYAVADTFDHGFRFHEKRFCLERYFREQDDVRRIVGLVLGQTAGGGDPAGVSAHDFQNEHFGGRLEHRRHIERGLAYGDRDVLGNRPEAGAGVGKRQVVVYGLGDTDAGDGIA